MDSIKPSKAIRQILKRRSGSLGICKCFAHFTGKELDEVMAEHSISFRTWPDFSGDNIYPVPAPEGEEPKFYYWKVANKWDGRTEYGKKRKRLAMWLVKQFEKVGA